jgi:hypothetical protein
MSDFDKLNVSVAALGLPRNLGQTLEALGISDAATLLSIGTTGLASLSSLSAANIDRIRCCLRSREVRQLARVMLTDIRLADLGLDQRLTRLLERYDILTAADLHSWLPDKIQRIPGIGAIGVKQASKALYLARRLSKKRWHKPDLATTRLAIGETKQLVTRPHQAIPGEATAAA